MSITNSLSTFISLYDGFIGLAPYRGVEDK